MFKLNPDADIHGNVAGGGLQVAEPGIYRGALKGVKLDGEGDKQTLDFTFSFTHIKENDKWNELPTPIVHVHKEFSPRDESKAANMVARIAHIMSCYHSDAFIQKAMVKGAETFEDFANLVKRMLKKYKTDSGKSISTVEIVTKITGRVYQGKKRIPSLPFYTNGFIIPFKHGDAEKLAFTRTEISDIKQYFDFIEEAGSTTDVDDLDDDDDGDFDDTTPEEKAPEDDNSGSDDDWDDSDEF